MKLRQLEHFMALCEEMHFTNTAEKLRSGHPALSYQMKALESFEVRKLIWPEDFLHGYLLISK
ncbi:LysR family transcriptional regulator [Metabacillus dongyingensis]|nr:LysR family transcriptional regulator [Metabacillus dongyingensis]